MNEMGRVTKCHIKRFYNDIRKYKIDIDTFVKLTRRQNTLKIMVHTIRKVILNEKGEPKANDVANPRPSASEQSLFSGKRACTRLNIP